jgi:hypothetical protein
LRADEEIARFCAEHGVTDSDLLIAQVLPDPSFEGCDGHHETVDFGLRKTQRLALV